MALVVAGVAGGAVALASTDMEWTIDHGGVAWMPVLGILATSLLFSAGDVVVLAEQCKDAKRRGAAIRVIQRRREARANARLQAVELWKLAARDARSDQCDRVRERGARIRELDEEFYAVVYLRDVAIARCARTGTP